MDATVAMILNGLGFSSRQLDLMPQFFASKSVEHLLGPRIRADMLNGYSGDHRADLKQWMLAIANTHDGDVPLFLQPLDGNSSDKVSLVVAVRAIQAQLREADGEESLTLFRELGNKEGVAASLTQLAGTLFFPGQSGHDLPAARRRAHARPDK